MVLSLAACRPARQAPRLHDARNACEQGALRNLPAAGWWQMWTVHQDPLGRAREGGSTAPCGAEKVGRKRQRCRRAGAEGRRWFVKTPAVLDGPVRGVHHEPVPLDALPFRVATALLFGKIADVLRPVRCAGAVEDRGPPCPRDTRKTVTPRVRPDTPAHWPASQWALAGSASAWSASRSIAGRLTQKATCIGTRQWIRKKPPTTIRSNHGMNRRRERRAPGESCKDDS